MRTGISAIRAGSLRLVRRVPTTKRSQAVFTAAARLQCHSPMSGILDLASHLRRSAAVILSLLDHINSGEPVNEALQAAAYEAARDLLALSQDLARSEREAEGDNRSGGQH